MLTLMNCNNRLMRVPRFLSRVGILGLACTALGFISSVVPASAATTVGWSLHAISTPSQFAASDQVACETEEKCDTYHILLSNNGDQASSGPVTVVDELPAGLTTLSTPLSGEFEGEPWSCTKGAGNSIVTCTFSSPVPAGGYAPFLAVQVSAPAPSLVGPLSNHVIVTGGGAPDPTSINVTTPISAAIPPFTVSEFDLTPLDVDGTRSVHAGDHPWAITNSFGIPSIRRPAGSVGGGNEGHFMPAANVRSALVGLPPGLLGNPQAVEQCTPTQLRNGACPPGSRVGAFSISAGLFVNAEFQHTGEYGVSSIYSLVPERGYPAEFGLTFANIPVYLYADVVRNATGYHVQVTAPGIPVEAEVDDAVLTFFGNPGRLNESTSEPAFLTNPSDCTASHLSSRIELDPLNDPANQVVFAESIAYAGLTGCEALEFHPTLELRPDTAAADTPAGLDVDLAVPQTSGFEELSTPPLKDAVVTLPEGLVVNPSAADGLAGCDATGPNGINIGSADVGAKGQDLGDPEATELGAGHAGGNASPYDDGYYHAAPGHCPTAATMGTVEAITPLLAKPVKGQIFLGTPACSPCSSADAEAGRLLKLYLEINDPLTGTILKLPGTVSANATTGRLTASFKENPQFPFSDLKLHFKSGPRAALVTPPTCGSYQIASDLKPWSAPQTPDAISASSFPVSSGPGGSACANTPAQLPNHPKFEAGSTNTDAGAYSPFVLKLSREDGSQRLKNLNVTLPKGLVGKLAGVQQCSGAQIAAAEAKAGNAEKALPSCPLPSELGTVNVGAGAGPSPFYVQGHAYLAGPYKGAPLSMAVITPAVAGPFDLGTVVVRAALEVNPETTQITVKSDPIPQIRSGIPLDVRSIAVSISRNRFTLNPTSCNPMALTATVLATSSEASLANPFQVGGCRALTFKPKLSLRLFGGTKRGMHPRLRAVLQGRPGDANIAKISAALPHSEFLAQEHIRTICTRVQFAAKACPAGSVYGHVSATSPLVDYTLQGPVYLRSSSNPLPDLVAVVRGPDSQPIEVAAVGRIDSHNGGIRTSFETFPDVPVSKIVLEMQGAEKGLLVNSTNLCKATNRATARFTAQNGKTHDLKPVLANSCKKKGRKGHRHG